MQTLISSVQKETLMNSLKKFAAMLTALVLTAAILLCMSVGMSAAGYIGLKKVNEVSKGSTFSPRAQPGRQSRNFLYRNKNRV